MKFSFQKIIILLVAIFISSCSTTQKNEEISLKSEFSEKFLIGTALNRSQIMGEDEKTLEIVKKHFNTITPENDLKWEKIHPELEKYDFEAPDKYVEFGKANNMFTIGHVLVWHSQTPDWVFEDSEGKLTDKETLLKRMKDHIFAVAGRYKDQIDGWDVVNEAIEDNGDFRKSHWYNIIGEEFIEKAFIWANEAAPNCELYYNDYNMWEPGKVERVVKLVKSLQEKGIKIDGIGVQGHWGLDYPEIEVADAALNSFSELGINIVITELDMMVLPNPGNNVGAEISKNVEYLEKYNPYPENLPKEKQKELADRYAQFFSLFNKYSKSVSRVTF